MSRLTRYTQQIFGSSASTNQMAEFGSFFNGTPQRYSGSTITPALVQGLSNYLEGWFNAVLGSENGPNAPTIEDMNALCYLYAYQLAYLLQAGVPEWDSATTYYTGDVTQASGVLYSSLTDTNLNNALTSGTHWSAPGLPGVLTPNSVPYTSGMTLVANQSLMWPNMVIGSGQTVSVPTSANLIGITNINVSGTGSLVASGTGIIRVI